MQNEIQTGRGSSEPEGMRPRHGGRHLPSVSPNDPCRRMGGGEGASRILRDAPSGEPGMSGGPNVLRPEVVEDDNKRRGEPVPNPEEVDGEEESEDGGDDRQL